MDCGRNGTKPMGLGAQFRRGLRGPTGESPTPHSLSPKPPLLKLGPSVVNSNTRVSELRLVRIRAARSTSLDGGTGRRDGFKIHFSQGSGSSILPPGTRPLFPRGPPLNPPDSSDPNAEKETVSSGGGEPPKRPDSRPWESAVRVSLDAWDVVRSEAVRGWKILLRLLKGTQLTEERRKLLQQLGTLAADRLRDGRWTEGGDPSKVAAVTALLDQLDRLDRKVRLEERLIAQLRARGHRGSVPPKEDGLR